METVKYNGVCPLAKPGRKTRWWARAIVHGEKIDLGYFDSQHQAAYELCKARIAVEQKMMAAAAAAFMQEQQRKAKDDAEPRRNRDTDTSAFVDRDHGSSGASA